MQLNPAEISELIKSRIEGLGVSADIRNQGTVVSVTDGICRIHGLSDAMQGEMLEFPAGSDGQPTFGLALNLERDSVGSVILGEYEHISEGDTVKCTGRILEVPVGPELKGRVVNALGQPIDGKGPVNAKMTDLPDLHRHQHSLIHQRPARKARRVPKTIHISAADRLMRPLANHVKLALESLRIRAIRPARDEDLSHERLRAFCRVADHRIIHRHIAPAQHRRALLARDFFKKRRTFRPLCRIRRSVHRPHAVPARLRQRDSLCRRDLLQKLVRHLHQNARSVARISLAPARPAMIEIHEDRQSLLHDVVRLRTLHMNYESHTARVMLELRIV